MRSAHAFLSKTKQMKLKSNPHTPESFDRYKKTKWMFGITPMLKSSKDC